MAFQVRFNWLDEKLGKTSRTYHNTNAVLADVITQLAVLLPLFDAASMGGMDDIIITNVSTAATFAAIADSNVDKNGSIKVTGGDGRGYDFNLPMINSALVLPGGALDVTDAAITNVIDEFAVGKTWRVNLNNPTDITEITGGQIDK